MIIGTRESSLAMRQTEMFVDALKRSFPDEPVIIRGMTSSGDMDQESPLNALQGFGAFVRELDAAILSGEIDVSVNSMKDMPVTSPDGICIPAILQRGSVEDVMLPCGPDELRIGATVGTSSVRRAAMIKAIRPDVNTVSLRGNIQTRMAKLDSGLYDAIILAKAGLERMLIERTMRTLDPEEFVPAPAQGAIAIACRSNDKQTIEKVSRLDNPNTRAEVTVERRLMKLMGAGCSSPIGINASISGNEIIVRAVSFEYSDVPIRVKRRISHDYADQEIEEIADALRGNTQ